MSLIDPAVYLLNKIYVRFMIVDTEQSYYKKVIFSPENRMKTIYVYVLEFMLTLA